MSGPPRSRRDGPVPDRAAWAALRLLAVLLDIAATAGVAEGSPACPPPPAASPPRAPVDPDQDQAI